MTAEKKSVTPNAVSPPGRCWARRATVLLFAILACTGVSAQQNASTDGKDSTKTADESVKKVDESEENYRQRMELRSQRYRQAPRTNLTYSSQTGTEKIDQLPAASREHIREQLRDMIIASRQWKPGEDVSDYPYDPSNAAKTDAKLLKQEREAWAEQLQKYQQREAAAYASEQAQEAQAGGSKGSGQKGDGREGGAGQGGAKGGAGAKTTASAKDRGKSARDLEPYEDQEQAEEAMSTAGVSESALSFLRGKGGQTVAALPQDPAGAAGEASQKSSDNKSRSGGSSADTNAPPGSLARSELAMLQGINTATDDASDQASRAPSGASAKAASTGQQKSSEQNSDGSSTAEEKAEAQPGTLSVDELKKLDSAASSNAAPAKPGSVSGEAVQPAAAKPVEPGTLEIAELKHLQDN